MGPQLLKFDGWYFPEGDQHMPAWMTNVGRREDGRLTYQYHKYEAALTFCRHRRVAIDVGAHIGLWSWYLARDFHALHAFEPMPEHRVCWNINMMTRRVNTKLYPLALGNRADVVELAGFRGHSGNARVASSALDERLAAPDVALVRATMRTLDSLAIADVDFLKIDTEGYELFVVQGAGETIARCKPVIIVEQKPGCGEQYGQGDAAAAEWLEARGYVRQLTISGDIILTHP